MSRYRRQTMSVHRDSKEQRTEKGRFSTIEDDVQSQISGPRYRGAFKDVTSGWAPDIKKGKKFKIPMARSDVTVPGKDWSLEHGVCRGLAPPP